MTAPDTEVRSIAAQLRFPLGLYGGNRLALRSRQIFTRFRLNSRSVALLRVSDAQAITTEVGATFESRNCRGHCFRPFCRVLRPTQHLACALFDVGVDGSSFGCLFLSTVHDHNHVRMWLAWTASKLPLMVNRQIADDLTATLEHLATSPRCDIGRQGCNEAMSAALLPTKKQLRSSGRLDRDEAR